MPVTLRSFSGALTGPQACVGETMEEFLETFDARGHPTGLRVRSAVHRLGLWHRAANVFLFDRRGRLLIQRRSLKKDVCPGAWDLSVAEHLQPGEDYEASAVRGLREELGVEIESVEPVSGIVESRLVIPSQGLKDYELQRSYQCRWDGRVTLNHDEVDRVRWIDLPSLAAEFAASPETFTPWFKQRAADVGLFEAANG